jgi:DNA-binding response OmpR family regulator
VLSRERLLDALYGHAEGDVTDRAIDVYVKRLREKLGDDPASPRYIATVRGVGYRAALPVERRPARP